MAKQKPNIPLDDEDLANLLVAVRHWQEALRFAEKGGYDPVSKYQDCGYFDNAPVYDPEALNDLCERMNDGPEDEEAELR